MHVWQASVQTLVLSTDATQHHHNQPLHQHQTVHHHSMLLVLQQTRQRSFPACPTAAWTPVRWRYMWLPPTRLDGAITVHCSDKTSRLLSRLQEPVTAPETGSALPQQQTHLWAAVDKGCQLTYDTHQLWKQLPAAVNVADTAQGM
jgi:hypothetical protein